MNDIRIDRENCRIVLSRAFEKKASNPRSEEYQMLKMVREDYPSFTVVKHTINKNTEKMKNKKTYRGLSYDYMEEYINLYESKETRELVLEDLERIKMIGRGSRNSTYAVVKEWFLNRYPEIKNFGIVPIENLIQMKSAPKEEVKPNEIVTLDIAC